jgi:histidine triad (HIT) family protein
MKIRKERCIFCRIVEKQSPAHIIYEDEHIIAFLDIAPMTTGK